MSQIQVLCYMLTCGGSIAYVSDLPVVNFPCCVSFQHYMYNEALSCKSLGILPRPMYMYMYNRACRMIFIQHAVMNSGSGVKLLEPK